MKYLYLIFFILLLASKLTALELALWHQDIPPLRREIIVGFMNNDGPFTGDDIGPTHGIGLYYEALYENEQHIMRYGLLIESQLSTFATGEETTEGARIQAPRERDLLGFFFRYGRATHVNFAAIVAHDNFNKNGLGFLTTAQQAYFHSFTDSRDVKNIDIGDENKTTLLSQIGFGFEYTPWDCLDERILLTSDFDLQIDFVAPDESKFFYTQSLLLGISKITDGDLSWLVLKFTSLAETEFSDINWTLDIALQATIPVCDSVYFSVTPSILLPLYSGIDDFYNPNPDDVIYKLTVGLIIDY